MTFWDHLDELRKSLTYPVVVLLVLTMVAFSLKKQLFDIVLAANSWNFVTHRLIPPDSDERDSEAEVELRGESKGVYVLSPEDARNQWMTLVDRVNDPGGRTPSYTSVVSGKSAISQGTTVAATSGGETPVRIVRDPGKLVQLVSTELPAQLMASMKMSFYVALVLTIPYLLYRLYRFALPALYEKERKYSGRILVFSFLSFFIGILVSYFIVFPVSLRFLVSYDVSDQVINMFSLTSYINMLTTLSILMGLCFELPVLSWILAIFGVLKAALLKQYRKHAFIGILIIAAVITPTTDIFTLLLVAMPVALLYELSVLIVKITERKRNKKLALEAAAV